MDQFKNESSGIFSSKRKRDDSLNEDVINYIKSNGFGDPIPELTKHLSPEVFRQHYYDKNELMAFCRNIGISTAGLKEDLNGRIELFLRTGKKNNIRSRQSVTIADSVDGLKLEQQVVNYKSDPKTRAFFARNIPKFTGFSALVQKQIKERLKNSEVFTYADAIQMHKDFLSNKNAEKKAGKAVKVAHESCQYNQFSIDYKHDQSPKLHTMTEAWMLVRNSGGAKTYERYKDQIQVIKNILNGEKKDTN